MKNVIVAEAVSLKAKDEELTKMKEQYEHRVIQVELCKREIEEKKGLFDERHRAQTCSFEQSLANVKVEQSSTQANIIDI